MDALPYLYALLLLAINILCWAGNLVSLPGNWLMLLASIGYAAILPVGQHPRLEWWSLAAALVIAILGEVWEFFASAAGATRQGGSRRGALMAIVGSIVGSLLGVFVGVPIPLVGSLIGAVGGGAIGAFVGAYYGERGKTSEQRWAISRGALWGRLFGTLGKIACGGLMLSLITLDSLIDWGK